MDLKRSKLDDIEDAAMNEDDPQRLAALYEKFHEEYEQHLKVEMDARNAKRRKFDNVEVEMMKTDDPKRAHISCEEDSQNNKRQKGDKPMQEVDTSSTEDTVYQEMKIDQVLKQEWIDNEKGEQDQMNEYAWDDVNDMELPIEKVREARTEEMKYMKGKTFKVVKKSEAYRVIGKGPISTKWVDTDKSHGIGEMLVRSRWVARDF